MQEPETHRPTLVGTSKYLIADFNIDIDYAKERKISDDCHRKDLAPREVAMIPFSVVSRCGGFFKKTHFWKYDRPTRIKLVGKHFTFLHFYIFHFSSGFIFWWNTFHLTNFLSLNLKSLSNLLSKQTAWGFLCIIHHIGLYLEYTLVIISMKNKNEHITQGD